MEDWDRLKMSPLPPEEELEVGRDHEILVLIHLKDYNQLSLIHRR